MYKAWYHLQLFYFLWVCWVYTLKLVLCLRFFYSNNVYVCLHTLEERVRTSRRKVALAKVSWGILRTYFHFKWGEIGARTKLRVSSDNNQTQSRTHGWWVVCMLTTAKVRYSQVAWVLKLQELSFVLPEGVGLLYFYSYSSNFVLVLLMLPAHQFTPEIFCLITYKETQITKKKKSVLWPYLISQCYSAMSKCPCSKSLSVSQVGQ